MPSFLGQGDNNSKIVVEVDSVEFDPINLGGVGSSASAQMVFYGLTTSKQGVTAASDTTAVADFGGDPNCFAYARWYVPPQAAAGQASSLYFPLRYDCTDGMGRGAIVATPNVYMTVFSTSTAKQCGAHVTIRYHLTRIGLTDWIALVEQQQTGN